jgi:hypothetical protein
MASPTCDVEKAGSGVVTVSAVRLFPPIFTLSIAEVYLAYGAL